MRAGGGFGSERFVKWCVGYGNKLVIMIDD